MYQRPRHHPAHRYRTRRHRNSVDPRPESRARRSRRDRSATKVKRRRANEAAGSDSGGEEGEDEEEGGEDDEDEEEEEEEEVEEGEDEVAEDDEEAEEFSHSDGTLSRVSARAPPKRTPSDELAQHRVRARERWRERAWSGLREAVPKQSRPRWQWLRASLCHLAALVEGSAGRNGAGERAPTQNSLARAARASSASTAADDSLASADSSGTATSTEPLDEKTLRLIEDERAAAIPRLEGEEGKQSVGAKGDSKASPSGRHDRHQHLDHRSDEEDARDHARLDDSDAAEFASKPGWGEAEEDLHCVLEAPSTASAASLLRDRLRGPPANDGSSQRSVAHRDPPRAPAWLWRRAVTALWVARDELALERSQRNAAEAALARERDRAGDAERARTEAERERDLARDKLDRLKAALL